MNTRIEQCIRGRVITGTFVACCHRVEFYYDLPKGKHISDELRERLAEAAEERFREDIAQDYVSGQLYYCDTDKNETEYVGWWSFESDDDD